MRCPAPGYARRGTGHSAATAAAAPSTAAARSAASRARVAAVALFTHPHYPRVAVTAVGVTNSTGSGTEK